VNVRRFEFGDEPALFRVFHSAIHEVACRDYTPGQIRAWAPDDLDPALWCARIRGISPFVVESGDELVGYADVQPSGYIDHFFVSGGHQRRGIGAMLMRRLHDEALAIGVRELTSDVSRTAEPFFARFGFRVVERRQPTLRGVVVPNALMRKILPAGREPG
jgi:putative acetyltransferase